MSALIISTVLLGFASQAAAQCTTAQHPNCVNFVKNGYCNNAGYTLAQKQATCGISCGLCTSAGAPIVAGACAADANANCANWANNGFCNNPAYTNEYKQAYCCKTCATTPPVLTPPTTTCAVIYEGDSTVKVNAVPTTAQEAVSNTPPLSKVYVKTGCNLKLYSPDPFTQAAGSPFAGSNTFVTLSGNSVSSLGYECTCP